MPVVVGQSADPNGEGAPMEGNHEYDLCPADGGAFVPLGPALLDHCRARGNNCLCVSDLLAWTSTIKDIVWTNYLRNILNNELNQITWQHLFISQQCGRWVTVAVLDRTMLPFAVPYRILYYSLHTISIFINYIWICLLSKNAIDHPNHFIVWNWLHCIDLILWW